MTIFVAVLFTIIGFLLGWYAASENIEAKVSKNDVDAYEEICKRYDATFCKSLIFKTHDMIFCTDGKIIIAHKDENQESYIKFELQENEE